MNQREMMLQAVNLLISKDAGPAAYQALDATSKLARLYPVALTGDHAPLNALKEPPAEAGGQPKDHCEHIRSRDAGRSDVRA